MVKNLIFLGAPGAGKGTLAKILSTKKGMIHISTGDIFRKEIKEESELGKKVKSLLDAGEYVPDEITNEVVKKRLKQEDALQHGFILDGYPRTQNQAKFLEDIDIQIDSVLLLEADRELVIERLFKRALKENRKDDTKEIIEKRFEIYLNKTTPLINWYTQKNLLTKIPSNGTIEENYENLLKGLGD